MLICIHVSMFHLFRFFVASIICTDTYVFCLMTTIDFYDYVTERTSEGCMCCALQGCRDFRCHILLQRTRSGARQSYFNSRLIIPSGPGATEVVRKLHWLLEDVAPCPSAGRARDYHYGPARSSSRSALQAC